VINVSMKTRDEEDKKVTPSWPIMMKAVWQTADEEVIDSSADMNDVVMNIKLSVFRVPACKN
jgi:hypothetical protein